jgi:hypothetical protein
MGRRIVTKQLHAYLPGAQVDTYFDRVVKYIPSDIVAAWTAVTGLVNTASTAPKATLLWILLVIFIVITAVWTLRQTAERNKPPAIKQTIISTGSFCVWVFALGGPFATLEGFYQPLYSSLALIIWSLGVGLFIPKES